MAYEGTQLLDRTTLRLLHGHRYGLIGRNGVGKSTLMRRLSTGTLPGFPPHLRVAQVRQELPTVEEVREMTPVEFVVSSDLYRTTLLKRISQIEAEDSEPVHSNGTPMSAEEVGEALNSLYELLEEEGIARGRAIRVLKEFGFGDKRCAQPLGEMSGGWRMRACLAAAVAQEPDILLLDEPTNHLDLEGVEWLRTFLLSSSAQDLTVLVISHDSSFLDDVCTDIIRFHRQQLHYYVGNYSAYETVRREKELNDQRTQESIDRSRKHIEDSIKRMQAVASRGDSGGKAQGAVASRKKKLARHGAEKNVNGHRFRVQQDSWKGKSAIRAGSMNGRKQESGQCLLITHVVWCRGRNGLQERSFSVTGGAGGERMENDPATASRPGHYGTIFAVARCQSGLLGGARLGH